MNNATYHLLEPREKFWADMMIEVLGEFKSIRQEMARLANALEDEVQGLTGKQT